MANYCRAVTKSLRGTTIIAYLNKVFFVNRHKYRYSLVSLGKGSSKRGLILWFEYSKRFLLVRASLSVCCIENTCITVLNCLIFNKCFIQNSIFSREIAVIQNIFQSGKAFNRLRWLLCNGRSKKYIWNLFIVEEEKKYERWHLLTVLLVISFMSWPFSQNLPAHSIYFSLVMPKDKGKVSHRKKEENEFLSSYNNKNKTKKSLLEHCIWFIFKLLRAISLVT